MSKVIAKIDWKELRQQKRHLVEMLNINAKYRDSLEGILNLIDCIQNEAALELSDKVVFGKK